MVEASPSQTINDFTLFYSFDLQCLDLIRRYRCFRLAWTQANCTTHWWKCQIRDQCIHITTVPIWRKKANVSMIGPASLKMNSRTVQGLEYWQYVFFVRSTSISAQIHSDQFLIAVSSSHWNSQNSFGYRNDPISSVGTKRKGGQRSLRNDKSPRTKATSATQIDDTIHRARESRTHTLIRKRFPNVCTAQYVYGDKERMKEREKHQEIIMTFLWMNWWEKWNDRKEKKISAKKTIHNFRDTNFMLISFELLPVLVHTCCNLRR